MATPIRITPRHGGDSCPHCPPYVNYNNTIQKFDNKVISRVQTRPNPQLRYFKAPPGGCMDEAGFIPL